MFGIEYTAHALDIQICTEEGGLAGEGGVDVGTGGEDQLSTVCYTKGKCFLLVYIDIANVKSV